MQWIHRIQGLATKQKDWDTEQSLSKWQEQNPQISFPGTEYCPLIHCVHTGPVLKSSLGLAPNPGSRESIKGISTWLTPSFQDQRCVPSGS